MPAEGRTGNLYVNSTSPPGVSAISAGGATLTGTVVLSAGPNITISTDTASRIRIEGGAGGGGGGGIALAGSNTTYTSGTVVLTGSNAATIKSAAGQLVVDVPTQTVQTQNLHNLTLSGNTAGAMAQVSSGTMTLAGGNNITLSQAGNAITISGPNTSAQQTGISSIGASNTTYTSGGITFTGSNAVTVRSTTGQGIVIDAPVQTVQTQGVLSAGVSNVGNTAGNTTVNSGQRLVFAGAGAATLSQATGAGSTTISVSVPTQTAQTGISSIGASNTTYTSGGITFTGSNAVTVRSTTGQGIVIDAPVQTAQTQNVHNLTISGNTAGAGAAVSSGTLTLAGGNNITLSQAGNAITISGAAAGGAQTGISSIAASNTTYTSGGITITGSNIVTVRSTTGQGIVIDASQSAQTQNVVVPAASNTTYTSGTYTITGVGGGVTVSSNTGQRIDISVAAPVAQTVQTQNLHNVTLSGNTAGVMAHISSGTLTLAGGANITLSQAGNAVTISGAAGGGGNFSAGVSNLGNSAGSTGITGTRLVLVGTNNITLSQSTDANGGTVSISATQSVQSNGIVSLGVSTNGNTLGDTGAQTGQRMVFAGINGITLSQSTVIGGSTITISGAGGGGGGGNFSAGVSTGGNTAGATGITGSQNVYVGSSGITLSQTTGANGGTITIQGPGQWVVPSVSWFDNQAGARVTATAAFRTVATANGSWFVFPLDPGNDFFPGNMTVSTMRIDMSGSNTVTTASTGSWTLSASYALYTRNGSTLSLLNSGSVTIGSGAANASNSSLYHGRRWLTLGTGAFSGSSMTLSQDGYWMGLAFRSSGEAKLMSMVGAGGGLHNGSSNRSGFLGVGSSTGSSTMLDLPFLGVYTATSTAAPVSITKGQVARPANTGSAGFIPHIFFDNVGVID